VNQFRTPNGGLTDRSKTLRFRFNGKEYTGHPGDTLASALLANGVTLLSRSIKLHRPRGILGAGAEEPNAILQIGRGDAHDLPNQRATQVELYDGLVAKSVVGWPSPQFDVYGVLQWLKPFLPAGFYYKTFMWPASLWMRYEHFIRRMAGLGISPTEADPDIYDKRYAHCDVLVVGAGPAGLAAALAAGRTGARVMLVDEDSRAGGSLLGVPASIDGKTSEQWIAEALAELGAMPHVRVLPRATAFGYFDHDLVAVAERLTDHLAPGSSALPRQRLWRVRARRVVLATGAIERSLVFKDNDRPGVMLASAVGTYLNRYGVRCGRRAVVFTNNDSAYRTALDLHAAGVTVAAVVDSRTAPLGAGPDAVRAAGIPLLDSSVVSSTRGHTHVSGVTVMRVAGDAVQAGFETRIDCDLLAISGGWSPAIHLHSHAGGKARWDDATLCFVPGDALQQNVSAGAAAGSFDLAQSLAEGHAAGASTAAACGFGGTAGSAPTAVAAAPGTAISPLWLVPSPATADDSRKFIDFQNDTTAADIALAVREGYHSIEHVKRYTALGFGTDQGKTGNINGMAILAKTLGQSIPETGTTTFRPAYTAAAFGALAGADTGELFDPVRVTPMHEWHLESGALFEIVGQWHRAWYYPRPGEDMHAAVQRECRAVRNAVGLLDYSTLGKIDIRGPDAAEFLERVYTNGWKGLGVHRCRYGVMLGEDGMIFDDGVTTRLGEQHFLMTTTTGGAARVLSHLERWHQTEWPDLKVWMTTVSDQWSTAVIAGPKSRELLARVCQDIDLSREAFPFMSCREGTVAGIPARVLRVSFTGELSFEIMVPASMGLALFRALAGAGKDLGITPYGTETMHVLRADKGFIIVGQDTDGSMTPQDMGMHWIVGKRNDFIGWRSLSREYSTDPQRKHFVGLLTDDPKEVIPEGAQLLAEPSTAIPAQMVGHVSSSYFSPSVERSIALALVKGGQQRIGEKVHAALADGRFIAATITKPLFYDPAGERQNV
jgi:sarcosine oxidase subunit alpha